MLITPFTLITFVSVLSTLSLGLLVFLNSWRARINQVFFAAILFGVGWLVSLFLFYQLENPASVLLAGRFNFAVVLPLLYSLFIFVLIFPRRTIKLPSFLLLLLGLWFTLFTLLTFLTPLVSQDEIITGPLQRKTMYGSFYPLYVFHYIIFTLAIITVLLYKVRRIKEAIERLQLYYVLAGLFLALLFGFITNILLPLFGIFEAQNYGPVATIIFSGLLAVAILKHHLFDIKVIAAEIFAAAIVLLLFINIFSPQQLLNIFVFVGSSIFAILLVRAVLKEVEAKAELERLDKAKTEFLSMASHQLRTPLTAIKGYISLLLEGYYGKLSERPIEVIGKVAVSTERLVKIVQDLLTISRAQMGKLVAEKEPTQIEELIMSSIDEMKIRAEQKGLALNFESAPTPLPKLNIDPFKIRQAILNFLDNAIRYTEKGGVTIKIWQIPKTARIAIQDTGKGIAPEELGKLFESFSRGAAGSALFIEGTGLGLYVAKQFAELHAGRVWGESAGPGKGSTFYIELPLAEPPLNNKAKKNYAKNPFD